MSARSTIVKSHGLCFLHDRNSLDTYVRSLCVGQESLDMDVEPASPLLKRALSSPQLRLSTGVLGLAREASSDLTAVVASNSKSTDPEAASNSKEPSRHSPKLPTTQTTQTTPEIARLVSKSKAKSPGFDFEQHYGVSRKSAGEVLNEILQDLLNYKNIHNWDDKLVTTPFAALTATVRSYYNEKPGHLNSLLEDAVVDEVLTANGVSSRPSIKAEMANIDAHLFFTKNLPKRRPSTTPESEAVPVTPRTRSTPGSFQSKSPGLSHGRVVYIKEKTTALKRASFLVLHAFCIRLQNEDYGFIRAFIERHLSLRCVQKVPYHWQQISPPQMDASRQQCYKRVTISCHLSYLTLDSDSQDAADTKESIDREAVFPFGHKTKDHHDDLPNSHQSLFRASSSVLLTLAEPVESKSHEEETSLLRNPEALWTVIVLNSPSNLGYDHEPAQYLTPIAQYVRGMASSVVTQRNNAQGIYDAVKGHLADNEGDGMFDDKNFTKSMLYHWAVQACDELAESISSSLRFLRKTLETNVKKLCTDAHVYEKLGIEYWMQRMDEELFALEDLESQIIAFRGRVQENRHALHGVTAVLEARLASQQSERMKTLAYLATIYLPLTSTASLYSMSVLPKSANFPSFFVVLAISLVLTILLGLQLPSLLAKWFYVTRTWPPRARQAIKRTNMSFQRPEWTRIPYIQGYVDILNPTIDLDPRLRNPPDHWSETVQDSLLFYITWFIFRRLPVLVLHHFLSNEVNFPVYQWFLYQHRHNPRMKIYYHWAFFIRDFVRAILLPAWVVIGGAFLCYLIIQDVLGVVCVPVLNVVLGPVLQLFTFCFVGVVLVSEFIWDNLLGIIRFLSFRC
ncbi:hypothetical protein FOZG_18512 [Fusarium oxysporum Fo47]|uniref:Uncharacterized protein n=1 Tax=Fusarium oxysporum Fo47 TaxID=660027 RepID=W9JDN5_FUSOX|nr:hypothetical protein FOZG_18512 [Fusarium oxysporum Fo47]